MMLGMICVTLMRHYLAQFGTIWPIFGTIWHNLAQFGTIWHNLAKFDTIWHNLVLHRINQVHFRLTLN
jgi:hypothetical protein